LQEELQSWYFGIGGGLNVEVGNGEKRYAGGVQRHFSNNESNVLVSSVPWTTSADLGNKPGVDVLEEAAQHVKAKVSAANAFGPPPILTAGKVAVGKQLSNAHRLPPRN
jgi:hypothetical protein